MISFVLNGEDHTAENISPTMTMLDYVRGVVGLRGTKEGCAEGDCGACTLVRVIDGRVEAVNSCLMQIGQADGSEIITVDGLEKINGGKLTPIQAAMAEGDGTQCGFCTPGFIGALFALGQSDEEITEPVIHDALAGNLCRCTGYRPIVDAAREACGSAIDYLPATPPARDGVHTIGDQTFFVPESLDELTKLFGTYPEAMLLSGGTDLGLSVSKDRQLPPLVIHTAHVTELKEIEETEEALIMGAAVTYTEALPFIERLYPSFAEMIRRIGSRQIRNLGTFGGNIGNASPIGDTPPCLIALDATLTLASSEGERKVAAEDFFLNYRKTDLKPGEVIRSIRVPKLSGNQTFRAYKISKRYDQDISAVIGAFRLTIDGETVTEARIAYGGMAATPKRAAAMEAALSGHVWTEETAAVAGTHAGDDYTPITDHRATSDYRLRVAANLLVRLHRDLAGTETDLEVVKI
ncbi:MAG: xanthine dehydrogenase small subunit [Pseudomonadota bacterium]|nr:xanthine dehydrogenase small subunit [Pseudomonadota bacterium]